eukprot:4640420-Prymnesium_polylepis.1
MHCACSLKLRCVPSTVRAAPLRSLATGQRHPERGSRMSRAQVAWPHTARSQPCVCGAAERRRSPPPCARRCRAKSSKRTAAPL